MKKKSPQIFEENINLTFFSDKKFNMKFRHNCLCRTAFYFFLNNFFFHQILAHNFH